MSADCTARRRHHRLPLTVYANEGVAFAITIGTSPRRPVFSDLVLARECVDALTALERARRCAVIAYCLMPDHAHLLVRPGRGSSVVAFVQAWKSLCYRVWRAREGKASFWQRGFWDSAVRTEEGLREASLYILNNPVRAGLVADRAEYPLSGSTVWESLRADDPTWGQASCPPTRRASRGGRRAP